MTINAEFSDDEGRCVLVGLQLDGNGGREVLNWALSKVAGPGDRVVAVNVRRNSDTDNTTMLPLIKKLDDYLAVYEGFCVLKQVSLVGRIARADSIRGALVREAEICAAMTLIVGVSKRGSTSLAKYCARRLPSTNLIALHNGKIVFETAATAFLPGGASKAILRKLLHPSADMDSIVILPRCEATPSLSDVSSYVDSSKGEASDADHLLDDERSRKLLDMPGWPLLGRVCSSTPKEKEAREMSVVQWAMSLPDRNSLLIKPQLDQNATPVELSVQLKRILGDNSSCCKWFSYNELRDCTNQFSQENLIGRGGSSRVYKASLPSNQQVAVKLSKLSEESSREFLVEADILTTLQHKHIVPLIGLSVETNNLITIYQYFSKGSLEEMLHGKTAKHPVPWDIRFKIATGIAEALNYLHNVCHRPVIHRDIKSSNILLSDEFEPQLSDFNLALWAPTATSHLTENDVVGTFGYLAPEYFMYGRVSKKIDVYAFGVVLLELLTGRKAINNENPKGQESLVMWAMSILERGDAMELLDPKLEGNYDEDQTRRTILVSSLCIARVARLRPPIDQILHLLCGEGNVEEWMNFHTTSSPNDQDDEAYLASSIRSHLGNALLDVDDDVSVDNFEQNHTNSLEEYLRGRWSRSSSLE